jgi:hypothetical protein
MNFRALFLRLFGPEPDATPRVIATCPNTACGWQDPITVSILTRTTYNANGVQSEPSGKLHRCPMCRWMFVVTTRGVQRCQFDADVDAQQRERTQNAPKDVVPAERQRSYPIVPSDMQAFFSRDPGT